MIIRRRVFRHGLMRSLGARLANFSRVRTDRYTHPAGEPPEASPIWQEAAERPLVWKLPTGAVPQVGPFESETPSAPAIGPDLLAIMHDHAERRALEREQDQPRLAQAPELPASSATPVQAEATRQRPMASSRRQGAPQAPAQASGAPLTRRRPMPGLLEEVTPSQAARSQASEAQGPPAVSLSAPLPAASEPALQPTTVAEPSDAPTYPEPVAPPWDDGVLVESPKPEAAADEIEASSAQLKTPDVWQEPDLEPAQPLTWEPESTPEAEPPPRPSPTDKPVPGETPPPPRLIPHPDLGQSFQRAASSPPPRQISPTRQRATGDTVARKSASPSLVEGPPRQEVAPAESRKGEMAPASSAAHDERAEPIHETHTATPESRSEPARPTASPVEAHDEPISLEYEPLPPMRESRGEPPEPVHEIPPAIAEVHQAQARPPVAPPSRQEPAPQPAMRAPERLSEKPQARSSRASSKVAEVGVRAGPQRTEPPSSPLSRGVPEQVESLSKQAIPEPESAQAVPEDTPDLYRALVEAGWVQPVPDEEPMARTTEAIDTDVWSAAPPHETTSLRTSLPAPRPHGARDVAPAAGPPQPHAPHPPAPQRRAVPDTPEEPEADLLALLGLPPDTPVAGSESPRAERRAAPPPQRPVMPGREQPPGRQTEPTTPAREESPGAVIAEHGLPPLVHAVSRAETGLVSRAPALEAAEDASTESEGGAPGAGPDIEKLARDVYSILRDRLRIERERSAGRW